MVTSPPYYSLRDYGVTGQIGLEKSVDEYVSKIVAVFSEVKRVLRDDGTLWVNIADTYSGSNGTGGHPGDKQFVAGSGRRKPNWSQCRIPAKSLLGVPARVALALQADGWIWRAENIWHKPNACPEFVRDRTTRDHEHVLMFSKKPKYYYNCDVIREKRGNEMTWNEYNRNKGQCWRGKKIDRLKRGRGRFEKIPGGASYPLGRNKRTVWSIPVARNRSIHHATYPKALAEICIKAGCPTGGIVLDPFVGSGTTALAARELGRHYIAIELKPEYCEFARRNISQSRNVTATQKPASNLRHDSHRKKPDCDRAQC